MTRIREVLINRQLSYDQAQALLNKNDPLVEIFDEEPWGYALEDEGKAPSPNDVSQPNTGAIST
jgi:hypothetical protein